MFVTVLPMSGVDNSSLIIFVVRYTQRYHPLTIFLADPNYVCAPKLNHTITFLELMSRFQLIIIATVRISCFIKDLALCYLSDYV